jgi:hypothetical protein
MALLTIARRRQPQPGYQTVNQGETEMITINAIKKLEKAGLTVQKVQGHMAHPMYFTHTATDSISFIDFSGIVECIKVRGLNDHDDMQSDYSAGVFVNTISSALRIAGVTPKS